MTDVAHVPPSVPRPDASVAGSPPTTAPASAPHFIDGLGERFKMAEAVTGEPLDVLQLRPALTAAPSFEFALRERTARLAHFRVASFARIKGVKRLNRPPGTLMLVSDRIPGERLSTLLQHLAERPELRFDLPAALGIVRQLLPAIAALHENGRAVAHGTLGPERLIVSRDGRLLVVEHVFAPALEQLPLTRERFWRELRVPLPDGSIRCDQRADLLQIGLVALALLLGRPLGESEFPERVQDLLHEASEMWILGDQPPVSATLRQWLSVVLELDPSRRFGSVLQAQAAFDQVLSSNGMDGNGATALRRLLGPVFDICAADSGAESVGTPPSPSQTHIGTSPRPQGSRALASAALQPPHSSIRDEVSAWSELDQAPLPQPATKVQTRPESPPDPQVPSGPPAAGPSAQRQAESSTGVGTEADPSTVPPARHEPDHSAKEQAWPRTRGPIYLVSEAQERDQREFGMPRAKEERIAVPPMPALPEASIPPALRGAPGAAKKIAVAVLGMAILAGLLMARRPSVQAMPVVAAEAGAAHVESNPSGIEVWVNGVERGRTPVTLSLEPGAHILELRGRGVPRVLPITVTPGARSSHYFELPEMQIVGALQVHSDPPGARVLVDGTLHGVAPLTIQGLEAGAHTVLLQSDLGSVRQEVTIEPGMTASLVVPLKAAAVPATGWIALEAPIELQVFEEGRLLGTSAADRISVRAGRRELEIVNEAIGYRASRTVQVAAGRVATVAVELPSGTLHLNALPWAEVWIDGKRIGETPLGNVTVPAGPHEVIFRHPQLGEKRQALTVRVDRPANVSVDLRSGARD
jgi:hypothetical protein